MRCKRIRRLLLQAHDQPLDAETQRAVEAHVAECAGCRRFADAMRMWPVHASHRRRGTPDLTERVLANVRPLPPPWVYHHEQQSKQVPHLVAFVVGALGVSLAFLMLCLTFVVAIAGDPRPVSGHGRQLMVPEVWHDVQVWMNTVPGDRAHAFVAVAVACAFIALVVMWFRTLSMHVGRDRQ